MALLDDMRVRVRVLSDKTDSEIQDMIDAALRNMRRVGIREELLQEETMDPMVRDAVALYCKANYGFDNSDGDRFWNRFQWQLAEMVNSSMNETYPS